MHKLWIIISFLGCLCGNKMSLFCRGETLPVHLAWLREEVRPLRRARPPHSHSHRREALPVPLVRQALHAERPPDQACPSSPWLPALHVGTRQGHAFLLLLLLLQWCGTRPLTWFSGENRMAGTPESRCGVELTSNNQICLVGFSVTVL